MPNFKHDSKKLK